MARKAVRAIAPRGALPRGLHLAGRVAPPGAIPSPSLVRPALSSGLPDLAHARRRPTTAGGADRHHGHLAHRGAKLIVSSASALCRRAISPGAVAPQARSPDQ